MLISECVDKYIEKESPYLKERTIWTYNNTKNALIKTFGDIDIGNFTQEFLQNYINECQSNGDKKNTIKGRMALLMRALKPYKNFEEFRFITVDADTKGKEIYTAEEIKKIQKYILARPYRKTYIPTMIAMHTGMRLSEITGLKWADVDFNGNVINIRRNVTRMGKQEFESLTKTKSGTRSIPMTAVLRTYLKPKRASEDLYVISNSTRTRNQRNVQRTNQVLCEKVGVRSLGMHAYRHAFATKLLKASQDFKAIADVMGHSSITITQNIYNHPTEEQHKEVVALAFGEKKKEVNLPQIIQPQVDYQPQINILRNEINELRMVVARLTQYIQDNLHVMTTIECLEKTQKEKVPKGKPKYKTVDEFGNETIFYDKKNLLENLDITSQELTKHLNGKETILDDIGVYVVEL